MASRIPKSILLDETAQVIAGVVTDQVVSEEFNIYSEGALSLVIRAEVSGVDVDLGGSTLKLQTAIGDEWEDSKTADITEDGFVYLRLNYANADDKSYLPLLAKGRLVITTENADDNTTVDSLHVIQSVY
jgi:hypothetical protein